MLVAASSPAAAAPPVVQNGVDVQLAPGPLGHPPGDAQHGPHFHRGFERAVHLHGRARRRVTEAGQPPAQGSADDDALGSEIIHVDFTRISEDEAIEVEVPLELVGIPKGVTSGGILDVPQKEVLVSALPKDIPESITLQIEVLEMGAQIRIKDLPATPNCRYVGDEELVVLAVHAPRTEAEAAPSEDEASEPEVIQRKESDSEESSE